MPNFQGAVNQVLDQAGLYSSLAGGPQELKERIRLGKAEKTATKQMNYLEGDIAETNKQLDRVKETGDLSAMPGIMERADAQGKELRRVKGDITDIRERRYQLDPSGKNYEAYMSMKSRPDVKLLSEDPDLIHEKKMAGIPDEARRAAEYDHAYREAYNKEFSRLDKMSQAMSRVDRQAQSMDTQKDSIRKHIEGLPTSLGGKVKDLDPALREQVIKKYMEANNGKQ